MKYLLSFALLICSVGAFAQNPIDGNWKGTRETPNGTFEINYTFKVEGEKLTGTWKTRFGETTLENGKVDGKKFSFTISFNDMTINNTGELISDNEIMVKNERGETKLTKVVKTE
ncbi:MAG: hypothetical protein IPH28_17065 [Cytophagaceae bacterium]|nr:hypothetical protein [Cytophagaceae bacterium]MBK9509038.1 hypothetical protein [Cytophagaceae bacterium]MBK9932561.1 hypothetical protein [Cytophagaceae bacterium]MBL0303755.1 hypothetical protein [Cytophagaceae bacterium]MBL0326578.1 hypothetical protein [Cytophagaceae bacterium]